MTETIMPTLADLGYALASNDETERHAAATTILNDPTLTNALDDPTLALVVGVEIFDAVATTTLADNIDQLRSHTRDQLANIPPPLRQRALGHWHIRPHFDAALNQGQTYRLVARIAEVGGLRTGQAMIDTAIRQHPAGGGGTRATLAALRRLNGEPRPHLELRFHAALNSTDQPDHSKIIRGAFITAADLFSIAEHLGVRATEAAAPGERALILNARSALLLDRAEALSDPGAIEAARQLLFEAWLTSPQDGTANLVRRLTDLSGHPVDRVALNNMTAMLHEWGLQA